MSTPSTIPDGTPLLTNETHDVVPDAASAMGPDEPVDDRSLRAIADGCAIRLMACLQDVLDACSNLADPKNVATTLRAATLLTRLCINLRGGRARPPRAPGGSSPTHEPHTAPPQAAIRPVDAREFDPPDAGVRPQDPAPRTVIHAAHRPPSGAEPRHRKGPLPDLPADERRLPRPCPLSAAAVIAAVAGLAIGLPAGQGP